ncbi:MAG: DUF89 family protein [Candidatus Aminicenantes bacterium]|nr:DUF89 family protein [Candidatus Aminicenantes bacterium]
MLSDNNCVGCVLNQVIRVCEYTGVDQDKKDLIFKKALQKAGEIDYKKMSSPEFAEKIYRLFSDISGEKDPYKKLRKEQNDLILNKIDFFREKIRNSPDPLKKAAIYSLMGNIIDYGAVRLFDPDELFQRFDDVLLSIDDYAEFRRRLPGGKKLVIIGDNAGEAVFDRLFIEEIRRFNPAVTIVYGVRSAPAINDMLEEDARYIGLDKVAEVIKTGSTFAGTVISKSTEKFQNIYQSADIVISKGQGNFETLEAEDRDILFMLKVKCDVVARCANLELGSLLFAFNRTLKAEKGKGR